VSEYVSFVVIAYNEAENIARTLDSINALDGLEKHEVIVVDDGSHDGTAKAVKAIAAKNPCVRLIRLAENYGRGYARRTGIAEATGELIATVDADIILPRIWLLSARAALRGHDAVGGTAVPDGDVAYIYKRFRLVPRLVGHTTSVTGSNALYRREVFDIVKFDSALREGEDVALNHAIKKKGLLSATIPGLYVRHEESKSFPQSLKWLYESGSGATRQLITYHKVRTPDLAVGAFVVAMTIGLYAAVRGQRLVCSALPVGVVLATSIQHVRSRFEAPRSHWDKVVFAILTDSVLLSAYFAGRLAGLKILWKPRVTIESESSR
jgi:glycosyltransferase involved in cell wall biosynthesis